MADHMRKSLLERLAERMGCVYLSDLSYLKGEQRDHLIQEIRATPASSASISDWNDALDYLTQTSPIPDPETAKETLISQLSTFSCISTEKDPFDRT